MAQVNLDIAQESTSQQILEAVSGSSGGDRYIVSPSDDLIETIIDSEVSGKGSNSSGFTTTNLGKLQIVGFSGLIKITASVYRSGSSGSPVYITKEGVSIDAFEVSINPTGTSTYETVSKNIPVNDGDIINFSIKAYGSAIVYKCNSLTVSGTVTKLDSPYGVIKIL